jgi:phage shock protein C
MALVLSAVSPSAYAGRLRLCGVVREWGMMAGMNEANGMKTLVRTRHGRMLAGVCSGLAAYFGVDVTLIRLAAALITVFTGGMGALAYLVAWAVIPEEGEGTSIAENLVNKRQRR